MVVTLIIANKDEEDLPSGHKRKKAGDIIAVCPEDHIGGVLTRKTHLLLKVDLGPSITSLNDAKKLMVPLFKDGELWYPEEMPEVTGKRRYQVPLTDLVAKAGALSIEVDINKVLDKDLDYQPLEKDVLSYTDMIQDKFLDKKLTEADLVVINNVGKG